ncbi:hypothetical protein [Mycobacterium nebraskense]|uniref:Uncharacterized protein n=1 Tax=Mycobacterium nebraskense TaxID=244292 RepID=A0A0F5NCM1_9MYCO|nr:hypothetical protein [Mycobacterium nebraskense]KKC04781.1 hypothetical protein WU83_11980 [Mycobacterium nebraskense]KLO46400.1 hypothetical protein ABW17_03585 [Mycobacterium nebraskense]MBI2693087.1 hypothetical protein [Mycobacterium nebraskense]MCV7116945.1 hypothetical protein [Mycobacterium nebraskense]ORW15688.1 hypothetical protein AWC17_16610 [Mycobacterium nebraskense]
MTHDQPAVPDVDRLARSMLMLHGDHHDHDDAPARNGGSGSWSKSRDFTNDPQRAAAVAEASRADRERYLSSGLLPVDCRFCHVTVTVRRLGPGHTAVQWNTEAWQRCAHFTEVRNSGGDTARTRSCPKLSDSIEHAVAEGYLGEPGDPDAD